MKFGGTSVGTAERIRQSAEIVQRWNGEHRLIVVVSALASVTDLIIKAVTAAQHGEEEKIAAHIRQLQERHGEVVHELFKGNLRNSVEEQIRPVLKQLRDFCSALLLLRSASPKILDVALPMGEKISARIFAAVLRQLGMDSEYVDSTDVLITDEHFGDASPDMHVTEERARGVLLPLVGRGAVPVITGYAGATVKGQPTTLGRGGSDSSATILGAALACDEVWIWTDVDGVMTADPRICEGAWVLPEITYAEAIELSYYGAKVIHHKAVRPAMEAAIPVWVKNSFAPEVPGTRIVARMASQGATVKAVTAVMQASLITLTSHRGTHFTDMIGRLFQRLGREPVDMLMATQSSSENSLALVVRAADAEVVAREIHHLFRMELKHGVLDPLSIQNDVAVIAVLGEGMKGMSGTIGRLFSAVAATKESVIAVAQGTSELNICFAIRSAGAPTVIRAVHEEFLSRRSAVDAAN